jgi:hypothetical protein
VKALVAPTSAIYPLLPSAYTFHLSTLTPQPTMASSEQLQSPFFGLLPAELRIKTYESLLADYKGDSGKATALSALLTCSRMKAELEAEMPRMGLLHLDATIEAINEEWAKQSAVEAPLTIEVMVKGTSVSNTELLIILPKSAFGVVRREGAWCNVSDIMGLIRPLFEFHLQQIDFILCEDDSSGTADEWTLSSMMTTAALEMNRFFSGDWELLYPDENDPEFEIQPVVNVKRTTLEWTSPDAENFEATNELFMLFLKGVQPKPAWALEFRDGSGANVPFHPGPYPNGLCDVPYKATWTSKALENGAGAEASKK